MKILLLYGKLRQLFYIHVERRDCCLDYEIIDAEQYTIRASQCSSVITDVRQSTLNIRVNSNSIRTFSALGVRLAKTCL